MEQSIEVIQRNEPPTKSEVAVKMVLSLEHFADSRLEISLGNRVIEALTCKRSAKTAGTFMERRLCFMEQKTLFKLMSLVGLALSFIQYPSKSEEPLSGLLSFFVFTGGKCFIDFFLDKRLLLLAAERIFSIAEKCLWEWLELFREENIFS